MSFVNLKLAADMLKLYFKFSVVTLCDTEEMFFLYLVILVLWGRVELLRIGHKRKGLWL